jgi:hypothetical protein
MVLIEFIYLWIVTIGWPSEHDNETLGSVIGEEYFD